MRGPISLQGINQPFGGLFSPWVLRGVMRAQDLHLPDFRLVGSLPHRASLASRFDRDDSWALMGPPAVGVGLLGVTASRFSFMQVFTDQLSWEVGRELKLEVVWGWLFHVFCPP